jgi:hypothetical protein
MGVLSISSVWAFEQTIININTSIMFLDIIHHLVFI